MLNKIVVTREVTLGEFAELLLFYDAVHLLCGESTIRTLLKQAGPGLLIPFLEEHKCSVSVEYELSNVCVISGASSFPSVSIRHERQITSQPDFIEYTLTTGALDCPEGFIFDTLLARRLVSLMQYHTVERTLFEDAFGGVTAEEDFKKFLASFALSHPDKAELDALISTLRIESDPGGFDIVAAPAMQTSLYRGAGHRALLAYADSISCLGALTSSGGDIHATDAVGLALTSRLSSAIERSKRGAVEKDYFVKYAFESARDIRIMLDSGEMTFREFIDIYEEGQKFRSWIKALPDDAQLLTEYLETINAIPALARLPTKAVRWTLFTGAGLAVDAMFGGGGAGLAGATGVSVLDAFILDKLLGKWKPNQYISHVDSMIGSRA